MNYLAHCFLSCTNEDMLIGNFITDFINKGEESKYSGEILEGIQLHRAIDSFTDKHPASLALRKLLRPRHGKYAPVVVDLIWDYFLSINWKLYSGASFELFCDNIYDILSRRKDKLPVKLSQKIDRMIEAEFLKSYADKKRMHQSLTWMDKRAKFKSDFTIAIKDIEENEAVIQKLFNQFFPELIEFVDLHCECNYPSK